MVFLQETLGHHDFTKFNQLKPQLLKVVDNMLAEDIAQLMAQIPQDETANVSEPLLRGISTFYILLKYLHNCQIFLSCVIFNIYLL